MDPAVEPAVLPEVEAVVPAVLEVEALEHTVSYLAPQVQDSSVVFNKVQAAYWQAMPKSLPAKSEPETAAITAAHGRWPMQTS